MRTQGLFILLLILQNVIGLRAQNMGLNPTSFDPLSLSQFGKLDYVGEEGRKVFLFENQAERFHPKAINRLVDSLIIFGFEDFDLIERIFNKEVQKE